jgi:hypothetical protein
MLRKTTLLLCSAAYFGIAFPALADDASDLAKEARRTDRATASAAGPTVAERIAADFPATFGTPEETSAIVADLREGMGYGEAYISLALAQELVRTGGMRPEDALNEVLGRRLEGKGWGAIARDLGLNLGHVVARARSGNERLELAFARPEQRGPGPQRAGAPERPVKPERPQRPERPERPERGGRS